MRPALTSEAQGAEGEVSASIARCPHATGGNDDANVGATPQTAEVVVHGGPKSFKEVGLLAASAAAASKVGSAPITIN